MENAKFVRLGKILDMLHRGEKVSIKALSEEFGVSERTLQRDIYQRLGDRIIKVDGVFQLTQSAKHKDRNDIVMHVVREVCKQMGDEFVSRIDEIFSLAQGKAIEQSHIHQHSPVLKITYTLANNTYKVRLVPQRIVLHEGQYWLHGHGEKGAQKIPLISIVKMRYGKTK